MSLRAITVKGVGTASAKPDLVVLSITLQSCDIEYRNAMDTAAERIEELNTALGSIGFEKDALKTTNFNVSTDYEHIKDRDGNYKMVFNGYKIIHTFDFDMERLAQALSAISGCLSNPQLSISFTVKDKTAINEEMLRSAAANSRKTAEILCNASGGELGTLMSIDYNWDELNIYSTTRYDCCDEAISPMMSKSIDIEPEDIKVSDTVTFMWEIK